MCQNLLFTDTCTIDSLTLLQCTKITKRFKNCWYYCQIMSWPFALISNRKIQRKMSKLRIKQQMSQTRSLWAVIVSILKWDLHSSKTDDMWFPQLRNSVTQLSCNCWWLSLYPDSTTATLLRQDYQTIQRLQNTSVHLVLQMQPRNHVRDSHKSCTGYQYIARFYTSSSCWHNVVYNAKAPAYINKPVNDVLQLYTTKTAKAIQWMGRLAVMLFLASAVLKDKIPVLGVFLGLQHRVLGSGLSLKGDMQWFFGC